VPADYNSGTRSNQKNENLNSVIIKSREMENENIVETTSVQTEEVTSPSTTATDTAENRAQQEAENNAAAAERQRAISIADACSRAGLDVQFASSLISSNRSLSEARAAIIDKLAERS